MGEAGRGARGRHCGVWLEGVEGRVLFSTPVGWTALTHAPPGSPSAIMQTSDGTVLIEYDPAGAGGNAKKTWARLTPDATGSYLNGTWSLLANANISRLDFASVPLPDGRVFTAGGEYGENNVSTNNSEIYDPLTNSWKMTAQQNLGNILDAMTVTLPNGDVYVAPVQPANAGYTMIYHVATDTWTQGPPILTGGSTDEETFVKLKDDTLLTARNDNATSERYVPWLNKWIADANVPVKLFDTKGELGGAVILPDGRVFFEGGNGNTALYTPSGTLAPGSWTVGPTLPKVNNRQLGADDAPVVMLPDGRLLMGVGPADSYDAPTYLYIYDPANNSLALAPGAPNINDPVFGALLMNLPDGNVLYTTRFGNNLTVPRMYIFNPGTSPLTSPKPTISNIAANADGTYTLTGTQLTGINEGNSYGDDQQQDTNYPLVRLTSGNNVYYARTHGWSNTGVGMGPLFATTDFTLPLGIAAGTYQLQVVVNGFASDAQPFTIASGTIPNVQTAAAAAPSPVISGTTTVLSVLGADALGGSDLVYTWVPTVVPAGAQAPSFSINGTNASKMTTATFYKKGTYTFKVYITDAGGLSTTSAVTVNVTSAALPSEVPLGSKPAGIAGAPVRQVFRPVVEPKPATVSSLFGTASISSWLSGGKRRLLE